MKHISLSIFAFAAVACCTPVTTPDAADQADDTSFMVPQSVEDKEMASTRAARSGENTYAQTCGPLGKALMKTPLPDPLQLRVDAGNAVLGDMPHPEFAGANPVALPRTLEALHKSAVCRVVIDLDKTGTPHNASAFCTDERFAPHAEEAVSNMSWKPLTANGKPIPYPGMSLKWEHCISD